MSETPDRSWPAAANRLGVDAASDDVPTRWVDELWNAAERDEVDTPWDRSELHPTIAAVVDELGPADGRRAVVVGVAMGADAEGLARAGWSTVGFDVSPAAVRLVTQRYPDSSVDYRVDDLLDLSDELVGSFDLVVEIFTVQAMPPHIREKAVTGIRRLLAPGGTAAVVQYTRGDEDPDVGPPWLLDRTQMQSFAGDDVELTYLREEPSRSHPDDLLWVARLDRAS